LFDKLRSLVAVARLKARPKALEHRQRELKVEIANAEDAVTLPDLPSIGGMWRELIDRLGSLPKEHLNCTEAEIARGSIRDF